MNPTSHFYAKGGLTEVELLVHKKTNLYYRPGSSDNKMINDSTRTDYKTVNCKDHVVLDLGSNIGGFIHKATKEGAAEILAYEPEPYNFEMLSLNVARVKALFGISDALYITIKQAAIGAEAGELDLIINPGNNSACSASLTIRKQSNRLSTKVKVDSFFEVLEAYKPSLIKMDIEGAEYPLLAKELPSFVKEITFELHGFSKVNSVKMHETFNKFKDTWSLVDFGQVAVFGAVNLFRAHFTR